MVAESLMIYKIASGLIIPAILGLVKLYGDARVLKSKVEGLQLELNESKSEHKSDITSLRTKIDTEHDRMLNSFDKRFEKLEDLIEKYFTWTKGE